MKTLEQYGLAKENEIREFWRKKKIPEKARKLNPKGKGFFMMDGPPYASGNIHMGTALNKILKDITIRQKRMQGFSVLDQPGYDTHGLPIENKVEKKLGFGTKGEIEKHGVDRFVAECKKFATEYIGIMNAEFDNLGVWMDWENPYLTLNNRYIEAIWWTFKNADDKGLLYSGKYPVHVCSHCETAVAYNEIEYVKQTDKSVYVKFRVRENAVSKKLGLPENTYLIIWTTTPWTLPSNTGVMVHPKYDYVAAQVGTETWVVAKERLQPLMDAAEAGYTVKAEVKGATLEGLEYESPLAGNLALPEMESAYRVILSDRYVNVDDGTGLVHTAPGCGKEDFDAGTRAGLPIVSIVGTDGILQKEAGKYAGKKARIVDDEIIADLHSAGALVYKHDFTHDYPVCWRCKSPLLMVSTPQWFFRVTAIRERMLALNETVEWHPEWGKDRFRNWLESLGDWPVSRQRYWGTPLPIWTCDGCGNRKVIGSLKELKEHCGSVPQDLHKPWIDSVKWPCRKCGKGTMKRVPEVLDVWFDAGVSSWGSIGHPEDREKFAKYWPADVNIEGKDQIRGWWNSQLITSTICFDDKPFRAISMHGMVLDLGKKKMSKSLGNIVSPKEVIEKHNRDYLRFYLARESKGEDMTFDWEAFKEVNRFFNTLWNSINYGITYLDIDAAKHEKKGKAGLNTEDRWIMSKLNSLEKDVLEAYNTYNYAKAVQLIEYFVLEEFSRTYIKIVRDRAKDDKEALSAAFSHIISALIRMLAPIAPHVSEHFHQHMKGKGGEESVHFTALPEPDAARIDTALEAEFAKAKQLVQEALSLRESEQLRLRWPLNELVYVSKEKEFPETWRIIADSANVKKFTQATAEPHGNYASKEFGKGKIFLDREANPGLKEEWELMELRRRIQDMRKQEKLSPNDKAELELGSSDPAFVKKHKKEIEDSTGTRIVPGKGKMEKVLEREFYIKIRH
ncbi:MAG: isoleucine--tRNA ligase [Candidatus Diapherotrites archaeon]|uniref:Isoleucine--tRNA ligase n=1 Tax=Candidatus Iainarchaeum sp. TaxID=3101447 RepID=A0A8T3YPN9_9ARCH|nr:isoleucine--tRNA ligase [Candidatus Diapherotrites archaeon]